MQHCLVSLPTVIVCIFYVTAGIAYDFLYARSEQDVWQM